MSDAIIVALITGAITLSGNLLANWSQHKKAAVEQAKRDQKLDDQIATMNRKLESHNAYAEKFSSMTNAIVVIQKDLEWMKKSGKW
jgi:hypothetical protein